MNDVKHNRQIGHNTGKNRAILLCLSFFIPFFVMLIALIGLEITPFGDHSLLISDANGYYINTLSYAGRMFRGMEGITYSFEKTLGGNMMSHLNGILLTPFAFLLALVDITLYPAAFTYISLLNLSLAGLAMYLFLADAYGSKRSHLIFSTTYALMGFQTANVFQAVFFCAAPVLPIMALGLKRLVRGKKPLIYILSIAYGLTTNAYFGFVLCVASVLFFFVEYILHWKDNAGNRLRLFVHYALSSLFGGLLAAVLWLPGFLSLSGGRLDQTGITDFSFIARQPLLEIGAKLFIGAISTDELVNGRPNIYVGLLPVALVLLFFMDKEACRKKKTAAGILLGIYLLSFTILAFDMQMHAGTTTNWFNFRYSYVFSFLLLAISAEQWERLDETPDRDIRRAFAVMLLATVLIFSRRYAFVNDGEVLLDYLVLVVIYLIFWLYRNKPEFDPNRLFEVVTLILVCVGLFLNYRISISNILVWETKDSDFQSQVMAVDPLVQGIKASDDDFYRMEINRQRTEFVGNDPMLYGYNGVGHGGSNERDFVRKGLYKLGIPWYSNRSYYDDGIPAATDSLLGIKYVIAEEDLSEEKGYERRIEFLNRAIYENHDALPVAVLSAGDLETVETELTSIFENLNQAWIALSGKDMPVFIEEDDITFRSHNMTDPIEIDAGTAREAMEKWDRETLSAGEESGTAAASTSKASKTEPPEDCAYIEYTFTAKHDGPVYVYERNGLTDIGTSAQTSVSWLGNYHAGDTVIGYIRANLDSVSPSIMDELCGRFRAAYADKEALHELSEIIRSRPVTVEKQRDSLLTGSFTSEDGQALMFTIPWDDGWTLYIDGQPTELTKVMGVFMAASVPAGSHSYEMRFVPVGLRIGAMISIIGLMLALLYITVGKRGVDRLFDAKAVRKQAADVLEGADGEKAEMTDKEVENDSI